MDGMQGKEYEDISLDQGPPLELSPEYIVQRSSEPQADENRGSHKKSWLVTALEFLHNITGFSVKGKEGIFKRKEIAWRHHREQLAVVVEADRILLVRLDRAEYSREFLAHNFQKDIMALEWRPMQGSCLAVACREGICVWNINPKGTFANSSMDFLPMPREGGVTSLSFDPYGRLLAAGSRNSNAISIWDVSLKSRTRMVRGSAGTPVVSWSPTGDRLISAHLGGRYDIYATSLWTNKRWDRHQPMVSAQWRSDGHVALTAFEGSTGLEAIYMSDGALEVMTMELNSDLRSIFGQREEESLVIEAIAWDPSDRRLVVSCKGDLALFEVKGKELIQFTPLGQVKGPDSTSKALSFDFCKNISWGALLAVKWSTGQCRIYPLIFKL